MALFVGNLIIHVDEPSFLNGFKLFEEIQHVKNCFSLASDRVSVLSDIKEFLFAIEDELNFPENDIIQAHYQGSIQELNSLLHEQLNYIEAAGGWVINQNTNSEITILLIHRRGVWDLPKGKIDPGENQETAALREVEEETGVQAKIKEQTPSSFHFYKDKNGLVFKKTYWFKMHYLAGDVLPQAEEDIKAAEWININGVEGLINDSYPSLRFLFYISKNRLHE